LGSLKEIRKRIGSVKNTQKVTKAMKLVAAAKLRRAQMAALASRAYVDALSEVVGKVSPARHAFGEAVADGVPALLQSGDASKVDLVLLSSDRGLCGGFNENLVRAARVWIETEEANGAHVSNFVFGRKGKQAYQRLKLEAWEYEDSLPEGNADDLVKFLFEKLATRFVKGESGKLVFAYNKFVSAGRQEITFEPLLPFGANTETSTSYGFEHIYEPSKDVFLDKIVASALEGSIRQTLLDNRASELAARMQAMDNATKNASEMIDDLTLEYNRARQAAITGELLDILGGASALN